MASLAKSRDLHGRMESALISLYGNDDLMHRFKAFKQATFDGLQETFLGCARNDDTGMPFLKKRRSRHYKFERDYSYSLLTKSHRGNRFKRFTGFSSFVNTAYFKTPRRLDPTTQFSCFS